MTYASRLHKTELKNEKLPDNAGETILYQKKNWGKAEQDPSEKEKLAD